MIKVFERFEDDTSIHKGVMVQDHVCDGHTDNTVCVTKLFQIDTYLLHSLQHSARRLWNLAHFTVNAPVQHNIFNLDLSLLSHII